MLQYKDIKKALTTLQVRRQDAVIVHVPNDLAAQVRGGAQTLLGAVLASIDNILVPSFTTQTMIIPEVGPEDNLMPYGSGRIDNLNAVFYTPELECNQQNSIFSNLFRCYPDVTRSNHPLLSFLALGLDSILMKQSLENPYEHIEFLKESNSRILLIGAEPSSLYSVHLAEKSAKRKQFIRWAATAEGIQECPYYPGCSDGFHKIIYHLKKPYFETSINGKNWFNLSLDDVISTAFELIQADPFALLCNDLHCERCNLTRKDIRKRNLRNPSDQGMSII